MKTDRLAVSVLALATCLVVATTLSSQGRGRRGPSPEVRERWGNYFTTVKLDMSGTDDRLAATSHVTAAAAAGHLSLLYLFDSTADPKELEAFEQALFNHNKVNPGLRLFRCGRIDVGVDTAAKEMFGSKAPMFVVYDKAGNEVGQLSMAGFHAVPAKFVVLLRRGSSGHAKLAFDAWVKKYGKFLREIELLKGREKVITDQRGRLDGKSSKSNQGQLDKLKKKQDGVTKETETHLATEAKLLELAKVPPREAEAKLVGEPRRGGRGGR